MILLAEAEALLADFADACLTAESAGDWMDRAPAVIRSLMERVRELEGRPVLKNEWQEAEARIASLEAERELLQERSGVQLVNEKGQCIKWPSLTPSEIAARVEQKRKERTT